VKQLAAVASFVVALALGGCGSSDSKSDTPVGEAVSDPAVVARVGSETIAVEAAQRVMQAQQIPARQAVDSLVGDSLLGQQLERESALRANYLRRVALARRLSEVIKAETIAQGPPTDAEVEEYTRRNWWRIDRPPSAKVAHFVVECSEAECDDRAGARALAEKIARAVDGISDPDKFVEAAKEFPAGDAKVTAEVLQPVAADGRIVAQNARPNSQFNFGFYHAAFAKAANDLTEVGEHSGIVVSPSGYHVMLLVEKIPEQRLTKAERTDLLEHQIMDARARKVQEGLLTEAKSKVSIETSRSFAQATEGLLDLLERR
jgi:peptidyl-prolyl cis-trans isomerase C